MHSSSRVLLTVLCWVLSSFSLLQAAEVEGVRSYRAPDHTRLVFDLDQAIDHKVFSLENPDRIVIDLSNTRLRGDISNIDLEDTPIRSVRSAPRDSTDTRVVLDLSSRVQPRSFSLRENDQYGHRLVIDLYDAQPGQTSSPSRIVATASDIDNTRRDIVVAISAGHGGDDPGAIGVNGLREKQVVLEISKEIERVLNQTPGYRPVMVRESDYYVNLRQQIQIAHQHNADLFIAIHADAFRNSSARGATVYALSQRGATSEHAKRLAEKENGSDLIGGVGSVSLSDKDEMLASVLIDLSMTASIASSLEVGDSIIASMGSVTHMRRTNVEQAAFVVLKSPDIPSLLIETGYVTNPTDAQNLASPAHRRRLASSIVDGITQYFWNKPPRGSLIAWQKANGGAPQQYIVSRGDSLSIIADRYNVSLAQLKAANGLHSNTIQVGQKLTIPGFGNSAASTVSFVEHVITRGETLSGIADNYRVPLSTIRETNQLNSDTIRVGQILRIPST